MGNQNLRSESIDNKSRYTPKKNQLEVLYQCQQGQVAQSLTSIDQYFIRYLSFGNIQDMQKTLHQLQAYRQNSHETILNLLDIQKICIKTLCGAQYRLRLIFQFSTLSINDQIQARKRTMKHLDYIDCCRVIIGCVNGLAQIQKQIQLYSLLSKNTVLNRVFVHPQRILLMQSGIVKLINPLIVSPYDRFQHKSNCYYSPQKLADFDCTQDEKSGLFQLGISLIHILTLNNCKDVYNGFEVKQDEIDTKIRQIWQLYSDTLICEILSKLTRNNRALRTNIQQSVFLAKKLQQKLLKLLKEIQNDNNQIQQMQRQCFSGFQLSSQTLQSRQTLENWNKQNMMKYSNKIRQNSSSLKYSNSFSKSVQPQSSYSKSHSKSKSKRKPKLSLYPYFHNDASTLSQNQSHIVLNNNFIQVPISVQLNKVTKQNSVNTYGSMVVEQPERDCKLPKIKEQSCVVVNYSSLDNLAVIASGFFHQNSLNIAETQKSHFLNSLKNKDKNCKQSYYYGNQLSQGLILKSKCVQNKQNSQNTYGDYQINSYKNTQMDIEPNRHVYTGTQEDESMIQEVLYKQNQQIPITIPNQNDQKNRTKKFEWKRTKFSKKSTRNNFNMSLRSSQCNQAQSSINFQSYRHQFNKTYNIQQINELMKTQRIDKQIKGRQSQRKSNRLCHLQSTQIQLRQSFR